LAAALAILGACGSSGSGNGLNTAPTFSLNGTSYTPKDGGGLAVNNKTCTITTMAGPTTLNFSALVAGFSSFTGLCGFVQQNTVCASKQNSQFGTLAIIKGSSSPPGPIGVGTYTLGETVDALGNVSIVYVSFANLNATCYPVAPYSSASGTVTITQVSPTVKGSATVDFLDAGGATVGSMTGSFDINTCNATVDLCAELNGTCTNTCMM
jgi:hypothetical protein